MKFRPRFSIRTLGIFVTLVCAYFGTWEVTKKFGVPKTPIKVDSDGGMIVDAGSTIPFVIWQDETDNGFIGVNRLVFINPKRCFYIWVFGARIKLPFEFDVH